MSNKPLPIVQLTGKDLQDLKILAEKADGESSFWEIVNRFSVIERLNRKTYNAKVLDFSTLENKEQLENALITSLACEEALMNHDRKRLAKFFRFLTGKIEDCIYSLN